jgi:hypothetical protein
LYDVKEIEYYEFEILVSLYQLERGEEVANPIIPIIRAPSRDDLFDEITEAIEREIAEDFPQDSSLVAIAS